MNKQKIKYIIVMALLFIIIIVDAIIIMNHNGLVGVFHLNDEDNTNEINNSVISNISINEKETYKTIYLDKAVQLTLSDDLGNAKLNNWNYNWISSDSSIATISSTGLLIGKSIGTASIRVTNKNNVNLYDIMVVRVINEESKLRFSTTGHNEDAMIIGEVRKLSIVTGGNIALNNLIWQSSDDNIIAVKDGYVEAKSIGHATITVYSSIDESYRDSISIEVKDNSSKLDEPSKVIINEIFLNNISISLEELESKVLMVGDKISINACTDIQNNSQVVFKANTSNVVVTSNTLIVGEILLCNTGKGQIKIESKYNSNVYTTIDFLVSNETKAINSFNLANSNEVSINNYLEILIKNNDDLIPFTDLIVDIEEESIAIYDSGFICPLKEGSTKVLVKYLYDNTKQCEFDLVVKGAVSNINISHIAFNDVLKNGVSYDLNKLDINNFEVDDELTFRMTITPLNTTYLNSIKIFSSDENIVKIDYEIIDYEYYVKIKFKAKGSVDLFIKSFDEKVKCQVIACLVSNTNVDFDFTLIKINNLVMGKIYKLKLEKVGTEPQDIKYTFSSSNPQVLLIGSTGEIMAIGEGTSEITVCATFGRTTIEKKMEVKVIKEYIEYEKATTMVCHTYIKTNDTLVPIDFNNSFLNVYQKAYLVVSVSPNNGLTKNYEVISSDESIVYVSYSGYQYQLYALKPGKVKILINNYENEQLNQEIEINVYDVLPKYYLPVLESNELILGKNSDITFNVDSLATYSKATYSFTNDDIVEIVNDTLIPKQAGTTTLIIKIQNEIDEYVLSLPIKVVMDKDKVISDYETYEIVLFYILHFLIYMIIGMMLSYIFSQRKLLVLASCLIVLVMIIIEVLKKTSISITLITIIVNLIGIVGGIVLNALMIKRGKTHE